MTIPLSLIFLILWLACVIPLLTLSSLAILWLAPPLAHLSSEERRYWTQNILIICLILAFGHTSLGFIGLIAIGIVLVMHHFNHKNHQLALATEEWSHVMGQVISATINNPIGQKKRDKRYGVFVNVNYNVDGQSFTTERIAIGQYRFKHRSKAEQILQKYLPGQKVNVYYQPTKPDLAVLEQGTHYSGTLLSRTNNLLILGTIYMLFMGLLSFYNIWEQISAII
ncbi:MAG TPA: DUF3592 domain-containing protein [Anaerolineae bacterium]|nr:DUF3592 domain-containing protein [Anaerolineae bacterium]